MDQIRSVERARKAAREWSEEEGESAVVGEEEREAEEGRADAT